MRLRAAIVLSLSAAAAAVSQSSSSHQPWRSPQETGVAFMAEQQLRTGSSPRPTPPPMPPGHYRFGRMDLAPRLEGYTLSPGTCGFVQSNREPVTCATSTWTCASLGSYIGCCEPDKPCTRVQTVCLDHAASLAGECDLPYDHHTICCSSASPACYSYHKTRPGSSGTFTVLGCFTSSGTASMVEYDPLWSSAHFPSSAASAKTQTGNEGGGGNASGGAQNNVGVITGGAVGGVAILGLIGLVAFLLGRRRSSNVKGSDTRYSSPQTAMVQSLPQDPYTYSSPPQSYDPHMSVYSQHAHPSQGWYNHHGQQVQGQYPPQQPSGYSPYGAAPGHATPSTASAPPSSVPSPNMVKEGEEGPHGAMPPPAAHDQHQPSELAAVAPLRHDNNRAELS